MLHFHFFSFFSLFFFIFSFFRLSDIYFFIDDYRRHLRDMPPPFSLFALRHLRFSIFNEGFISILILIIFFDAFSPLSFAIFMFHY